MLQNPSSKEITYKYKELYKSRMGRVGLYFCIKGV